jgi:hypothetical protein
MWGSIDNATILDDDLYHHLPIRLQDRRSIEQGDCAKEPACRNIRGADFPRITFIRHSSAIL